MASALNPGIELLPGALPESGGHGMPRLLGGLAASLAVGVIADRLAGNKRWPTRHPTFTIHDAEHGASDDTLVVVDFGFNSVYGPPGNALLPALQKFGRVAMLRGADSGFDLADHTQTVSKLANDVRAKTVVTYGLSMGGTKSVPVAAHLKNEDNLEVFPVLDCSPLSFEDVKGQGRRAMLGYLARAHRLHVRGGPGLRFVLETVGYAIDGDKDRPTLRQSAVHAYDKLRKTGTPSNGQCLGSAGFMVGFEAQPYLEQLKDRPFAYLRPEDPDKDGVVDVVQATNRLFTHIEAPVTLVSSPDTGHANPVDHPQEYQRMATEALSGFDLQTAEQRRATIYL